MLSESVEVSADPQGGGDSSEIYELSSNILEIKANIEENALSEITDAQWTAVTKIIIGDSVTSIADGSLSKCSANLKEIVSPIALKDNFGDIFGSFSYGTVQKIVYRDGDSIDYVLCYPSNSNAQLDFSDDSNKDRLRHITISGGKNLQLKANAFKNLNNLETVTLSGNFVKINGTPFVGNGSLTSVTLNYTGTSTNFKYALFSGCTSLVSVNLTSKSNLDMSITGMFSGCTLLKSIDLSSWKLQKVGPEFFKGCTSLESVVLSSNTKSLQDRAFQGCTSLQNIDFNGSNITSIGDGVFDGCSGFTSDVVINGILVMAVEKESGIYVVPEGVTQIHDKAFVDCTNMTEITFSSTVTAIGTKGATQVGGTAYIPGGYLDLEEGVYYGVFSKCTQLSKINNLPSGVVIGDFAFKGTSLEDPVIVDGKLYYMASTNGRITVPSHISSITDYAFAYDTSLIEVSFESTAENIQLGYGLFYQCSNLRTVSLPEGISYIGSSMFSGCASLTDFNFPGTLNQIYAQAFANTGLTALTIPRSVSLVDDSAFTGCQNLKTVEFEYDDVKVGKYVFMNCTALESVSLPKGMETVPMQMFYNCSSLTTVIWPDNLKVIDSQAFLNTGFVELTIPEGVTDINMAAFGNCGQMTNLVLPSTISTDVDRGLGSQCFYSLGSMTSDGVNVVLRGCPYVQNGVFANAKINNLIIEGVPVFHNNAFVMNGAVATIVTITVSGGSTFDCPNTLSVLCDKLETDGKIAVRMESGSSIVDGKILTVSENSGTLNIPADVVALSASLIKGWTYSNVTVDEGNRYFLYRDGALYFRADGFTDSSLTGSTLVYANQNNNGTRIADYSVQEGVISIAPYALYWENNSEYINTIVLPTSIKDVSVKAITNVRCVATLSETELPNFGYDSGVNEVYFKFGTSDTLIAGLSASSDHSSAVFSGYFTSNGDSLLMVKTSLGALTTSVESTESGFVFDVVLSDAYSASDITVLEGFSNVSNDLQQVEKRSDGKYTVPLFSGSKRIVVTGVRLNQYSVTCQSDDTAKISFSKADMTKIDHGTDIKVIITPSMGYKAGDDFKITVNGSDVQYSETEGRYVYSFKVTQDVNIAISGMIPVSTFTVSFDNNTDPQTVVSGHCATYPTEPVKSGYIFLGWTLNDSIYDFTVPVTSNISLKAKWADERTENVTILASADNGSVTIYNVNLDSVISSGSKVLPGTCLRLTFDAASGYEASAWIINGARDDSNSKFVEMLISSDTVVKVESLYSVSSYPYLETDIEAPHEADSYRMIWKLQGVDGGYNNAVYTPAILGDYIYAWSGSHVYKISLATGEIIKNVDTGASVGTQYYNMITVGNGYVLAGAAGIVYDQNLEPAFILHKGTLGADEGIINEMKVYYDNGFFYVFTATDVYKFIATDQDATKGDNIQYPIVSSKTMFNHYISWYQGQSNLIFTDDFVIGIEISGQTEQNRHLVTYDLDTLQPIDSYLFTEIEGANLNTGYISYYNGTVYFNTYSPHNGLFSQSSEYWNALSSIELDDNGYFNDGTIRYYDNFGNAYPTSLIVVGEYGYLNIGINGSFTFYVIDMKTMKAVSTSTSTMSHGNMTVSKQGDKVYAYIIPYNSSQSVYVFEHDQSTNTLRDVRMRDVIDTKEYSSQIVHFGPHGEILYYNDSGYLFCIAPEYTASFSANGGSVVNDIKFYISETKELPLTEKEGFWFAGWYDNPSFIGDAVVAIDVGTVGDRAYYAKFIDIDDDSLINSVTIKQFIDGGKSVMLSVDAGTKAPEKALVITYSAYVDLPEGTFLNPFLTECIELPQNVNKTVFTPKDALKVESITVTCCYEIDSVLYSTPYVKAIAPTVYSVVDLSIDASLTLSFNNNPVVSGESMRYGFYTVKVDGEENAQYLVNDIVADGNNRLYYYGQPLTVIRAEA